jgi:eukaryotic-like serine/threonine-protein kinase
MVLVTCPNGHRREAPSGSGLSVLCPVCGLATELLFAPGQPTSGEVGRTAAVPDDARPIIPGYEIHEEIGRGGMGIVYKARQVESNRVVALKVIRKDRLTHPEAVRRFRREAQAAARLSHPNIVIVHDSDQAGDVHYLAMEYVDGITLQVLVEQFGPLPVAQACDYIRQVAQGLQHACEQALVHRDIKPANLMVVCPTLRPGEPTRGGPTLPGPMAFDGAQVKLLDMGVARLYQLSDNQEEIFTTLTQDGAMIGTPDYIAPEQLENAHAADIRADLYSLGCTFHFLLTGQVPFPGGTLIQKLDKQRWATPVSADQLRPEIPPAVATVVRKLMAKKPADRYQTAAELVAALDELARTGHVASAPRSPSVREARRCTGHSDCVWTVAASGDGTLALSGGKDRTIRLWNVADGSESRVFPAQTHEVRSVALSPDGRLALSASGASVRLWDVANGRELGRFTGHTDAIKSVAFSPDGRQAVSAGDDKTLRLWEVQSRRELRRFAGHTRDITSAVFGSRGRWALTGSRDQTMRLWDLATGRELRCFAGQRGLILGVALSPDESLALSANYDTTLRLWDVATGRELRRFQGHKQMVAAVAFAGDGRRVLSASHDQTLRLWDVETTRELCICEGHSNGVTSLAVLPDGRQALSGSADGSLCLWQLPE